MHALSLGPHCYGVLIVKPEGRFSRRKVDAEPKNWKGVRWAEEPRLNKEKAEQDVANYNRSAKRLKWSSWAILWADDELKRFLEAGEDAQVFIPSTLPTGKTSNDGTGLDLHTTRMIGKGYMRVSLDCGYITFDDWKSMDASALRKLAMEQVEKTLAEVKAAIAPKPRRKRRAAAA